MFPSHITASLTHPGFAVELIEDILLHADVVGVGVQVDGGGRGHAYAHTAVAGRRALLGCKSTDIFGMSQNLSLIMEFLQDMSDLAVP